MGNKISKLVLIDPNQHFPSNFSVVKMFKILTFHLDLTLEKFLHLLNIFAE